ncbi:hypothetical protein C8J55DRAFT_123967 [Lentinula edodes]|uniref:Carbohydrate esterase family 16 protein n=1 Tax=Lentinula lateritia TaxID=40482 RepID=A0A9W9A729_9AGAR|nr:hypothetical protein C8J55DRAFT_123967 [Lentinula edodes]
MVGPGSSLAGPRLRWSRVSIYLSIYKCKSPDFDTNLSQSCIHMAAGHIVCSERVRCHAALSSTVYIHFKGFRIIDSMVYPPFISTNSTAIQISNSWPSITSIRKIVIFGDSYSSVGYQGKGGDTAPRAAKPLGVDFPGYPLQMWNEEGTPNWVGHLITKYMPEPRYKPNLDEQDEGYAENPILVYDYAVGGATIDGVKVQVEMFFLGQAGVGTNPDWARWSSEETLFVTWVGINDCAWSTKHVEAMAKLYNLQEQLYNAGARNFLFIDVPPIARSPAVPTDRAEEAGKTYLDWNNGLRSGVVPFAQSASL